ncbi:T9SS type A sorting domain-containing protein [Dyadobacter diqingensis]|uniref:T9SS type A sorting domain-containing protein n=1 Tax=Dyadobacter diqingensis TaxID=2938121 RepID=UPI0020C1969D|nr:T9SS type A sorting domain-containing protein [Dyadobacter diqingensis]
MKKIYFKQFLLFTITALLPVLSFAQIYQNSFTGASACPTAGNVPVMDANATGTAATRSTMTCTMFANAFNSTTLNNTAAINDNSYIEFSVTAAPGYQLNLTSLSFFRQGSASAPNQLEIRYSTDGFATSTNWGAAPNTTTTPGATTVWDFADFSTALGATITFRIYPYGTQRSDLGAARASTGGTIRLDNIIINGTVSNPMPVKLISFEGAIEENVIALKWSTAWEEQNQGFEIQRSSNAVNFETIGYVDGKSTVKNRSDYSFKDTDVHPGQTYYFRLKQLDLDGSFEFSRIIAVNADPGEDSFIFPNPNTGNFTVSTSGKISGHFKLYNASGAEIPIDTPLSGKTPNSFVISPKGLIRPGIYHLKVISTDNSSTSKPFRVVVE